MSSDSSEARLRNFLLVVVTAVYVGAIFELILIGHDEEPLQWIPFVISALGLLAVSGIWFFPSANMIRGFRVVMILSALVSFIGMYLHFSGNLAFVRETNSSYTLAESIWPAMKGGNPLMAPGIFLLAGILGLGAVYKFDSSGVIFASKYKAE